MAAEFDDLMKQLGVKPMKKSGGTLRKKARPVRKKPPSVSNKKVQSSSATPQIDRAQALERTLAVAKEERASAEAKLTNLKKRVRRLKTEKAALEQALAKPTATLAQTLSEWGFLSPEERSELLMMDGWMERLISHPCLEEDEGIRTEIEETMARVCEECLSLTNKKILLVKPKRCIVCGGVDLKSASRMFVDAALLHGRLRIVIVGRSTVDHRAVRSQIGGDKRLVLTQLPGDIRRDVATAQTDVDHADAVIVWDEASVPHELLQIYRSAERYGAVAAGPLGIFLDEAAKIISND